MSQNHLLIVVDDADRVTRLETAVLNASGVSAQWVRTVAAATTALQGGHDAVLADLDLPDGQGLRALDMLMDIVPRGVPVVALMDDEVSATPALTLGASAVIRYSEIGRGALARCVRAALNARRSINDGTTASPLRPLFGSTAPMVVVGVDGRVSEVNGAFVQLSGRTTENLLGVHLQDLAAPGCSAAAEAAFAPPPPGCSSVDLVIMRPDGERVPVEVVVAEILHGGDTPTWAMLFHDISGLRAAEALVEVRGQLLDAVKEAMIGTDRRGLITYLNAAAEDRFDVVADLTLGQHLDGLLSLPGGLPSATGVIHRRSPVHHVITVPGDDRPVSVWLTPQTDVAGVLEGWILVVGRSDAHDAPTGRADLHIDALTGLGDRARLLWVLAEDTAVPVSPSGLVLLDLDDFRNVRHAVGHEGGEEVLRAVADRIREVTTVGDTIVRLTGDTFAVHRSTTSAPALRHLAQRMVDAVRFSAIPTSGGSIRVSASAGTAVSVVEGGGKDALLVQAEAALTVAKRVGDGRVEAFDEAIDMARRRRMLIRDALLDATPEKFDLVYQPQVRLSTGSLVGVEALLRWSHPELGSVSPQEFLPVTEQTGFILPLGRMVLERACAQLAVWLHASPRSELSVAVNVSARQLDDATLVAAVADVLDRHRIPPHQLCLEITETALTENIDLVGARLEELKGLGVRLAIDDFGTGNSSLAHLRRLPIDQLKINRAFVSEVVGDGDDAIIVSSIARMASKLDLEVVAEGVETAVQRDHLVDLGCDLGQGWLWAAAQTPRDLKALMEDPDGAWPAAPAPKPLLTPEDEGPAASEVALLLRHELGNPVHVIKLYATWLGEVQGSAMDPQTATALRSITQAAGDMEVILRDLSDLNLLTTGVTRPAREVMDLLALAAQVVSDLSDRLIDHPVLVREADPGPMVVHADPVRMRQILTNLLLNIVRHTPAGTPVTISGRNHEEFVEVSVVDEGPGIPAGSRLFEKFFKARPGPGTGLGLYLSRGLARSHGGDLRYQPNQPTGAAFVLTIPAPPEPGFS